MELDRPRVAPEEADSSPALACVSFETVLRMPMMREQ